MKSGELRSGGRFQDSDVHAGYERPYPGPCRRRLHRLPGPRSLLRPPARRRQRLSVRLDALLLLGPPPLHRRLLL